MKVFSLITVLLWVIISGCDSPVKSPDPVPSQNLSLHINENGDTVIFKYREDGSLMAEITIKNGLMNGLAINYYKNGKIQNEINYKDGLKNGRVTWNYENGNLYRESQYVKGEIEGIQKKYYENGKLMAEIPYIKGELQPGTKEYTSDGKLKKIYPEIIFQAIDKMAFENKYLLRVSLSKKQKDMKFTRLLGIGGKTIPVRLDLKGDYTEISWFVTKGSFVMEQVRISAEFNTQLGNPMRMDKTYNVAAVNR